MRGLRRLEKMVSSNRVDMDDPREIQRYSEQLIDKLVFGRVPFLMKILEETVKRFGPKHLIQIVVLGLLSLDERVADLVQTAVKLTKKQRQLEARKELRNQESMKLYGYVAGSHPEDLELQRLRDFTGKVEIWGYGKGVSDERTGA